MMTTPNGPFYLGPQPKPGDNREYNAFGFLKDFGKMAAEYYAKKDKEKMMSEEMTLAEHAELWWTEQGKEVPPADTPEYQAMYEEWHAFAFMDFN